MPGSPILSGVVFFYLYACYSQLGIRAEFAFGIVFIDVIVRNHVGIGHLVVVPRTDGTHHGIAPNPYSVGRFPYRVGTVSRIRVELADVLPDAEYHPVGFRIGA